MKRMIFAGLLTTILVACAEPVPMPNPPSTAASRPTALPSGMPASSPAPTLEPTPIVRVEHVAELSSGRIDAVSLSPDGSLLAIGTSYGVELRDAQTLVAKWKTDLPGLTTNTLAWPEDGTLMVIRQSVLPGNVDSASIHSIGLDTGRVIDSNDAPDLYTMPPILSRDGQMLAVDSVKKFDLYQVSNHSITASLPWDVERFCYEDSCSRLNSILWSPDGHSLAASSINPDVVRVWEVESKQIVAGAGIEGANAIAFSPQNNMLAAAGSTTVQALDLISGKRLWQQPLEKISQLVWSERGLYAVQGRDVLRLDPAEGQVIGRFPDALLAEYTTFGGEHLLAGLHETLIGYTTDTLRNYSSETLEIVKTPQDEAAPPYGGFAQPAYSPDGTQVAIPSETRLTIWNVQQQRILQNLPASGPVVWSPDGAQIAVSDPFCGKSASIWDVQSQTKVKELPLGLFCGSVAAWPVADRLVVSGYSRQEPYHEVFVRATVAIGTIDIASGQSTSVDIAEAYGNDRIVDQVTVSPDMTRVAFMDLNAENGQYDVHIRIKTGDEIVDIAGLPQGIKRLVWSPDSTSLLAQDYSDSITVWDAGSGAKRSELEGSSYSYVALSWLPNSRTIVGLTPEGEDHAAINLWDASTGKSLLEQRMVRLDSGPLSAAVFSPNGQNLLLQGKGVALWRVILP